MTDPPPPPEGIPPWQLPPWQQPAGPQPAGQQPAGQYPPGQYPPVGPGQQGPYRPPEPQRRFSTGGVLAGMGAYGPVAGGLSWVSAVTTGLLDFSNDNAVLLGLVLILVSWVVPIGIGITMILVGKASFVRGFGLGMAIGWAAWMIIGAGVCFGAIGYFSAGNG